MVSAGARLTLGHGGAARELHRRPASRARPRRGGVCEAAGGGWQQAYPPLMWGGLFLLLLVLEDPRGAVCSRLRADGVRAVCGQAAARHSQQEQQLCHCTAGGAHGVRRPIACGR